MNQHNKIISSLKIGRAKYFSGNKINIKSIEDFTRVSAITFSCLLSLPSFAQPSNCQDSYWNGSAWVCHQPLPDGGNPWGNPNLNGNGNNPGGQNSGGGCDISDPGCHSDEDGGDTNNQTQICSALVEAELRTLKQNTPGCIGDPGAHFDVISWQQNETSGIWNWLTEPIGGVWHEALPALDLLAHKLKNNGSDMIAAYPAFEDKLWTTCQQEYPYYSDFDGQQECLRDSYYLLNNYYPGTALSAYIVNWFFGTDFSTVDYDQTWGGRFVRDLNNHLTCHAIYKAWDEENCNGNL